MTAQEVLEIALALLDETEDLYPSIKLINLVQREIAKAEGVVSEDIYTLDDELSVSDDSAGRIMPYGLAARFALIDGSMDMYADNLGAYRTGLSTIPADETEIIDVMGATW